MLGASYTLFRNEHVRVDIVYSTTTRTRLWVDVFGFICFMLPAMILLTWMTWPFFLDSWFERGLAECRRAAALAGEAAAAGRLSAPVAAGVLRTDQAHRPAAGRAARGRGGGRVPPDGAMTGPFAQRSPKAHPMSTWTHGAADVRRLSCSCCSASRWPSASRRSGCSSASSRSSWASYQRLSRQPAAAGLRHLSNDLLLSIPFFTLMGAILERCGLAEDLLEGTGQLFGKVPGGLAYAV